MNFNLGMTLNAQTPINIFPFSIFSFFIFEHTDSVRENSIVPDWYEEYEYSVVVLVGQGCRFYMSLQLPTLTFFFSFIFQ